MKTLEDYLRTCSEGGAIDHIIRASVGKDGQVTMYIHAHGKDSDTLDFVVRGNGLRPDPAVKRPGPAVALVEGEKREDRSWKDKRAEIEREYEAIEVGLPAISYMIRRIHLVAAELHNSLLRQPEGDGAKILTRLRDDDLGEVRMVRQRVSALLEDVGNFMDGTDMTQEGDGEATAHAFNLMHAFPDFEVLEREREDQYINSENWLKIIPVLQETGDRLGVRAGHNLITWLVDHLNGLKADQ